MLGKYDSFRDEALHALCLADWANESNGDCSDYGVYFWRISNEPQDVATNNQEFNSLVELLELEHDTPELRQSLIGHFLVSENDQGLVSVRQFENDRDLIARYAAFEAHYLEFLGDDEIDA
jgi:hypothetical protein